MTMVIEVSHQPQGWAGEWSAESVAPPTSFYPGGNTAWFPCYYVAGRKSVMTISLFW